MHESRLGVVYNSDLCTSLLEISLSGSGMGEWTEMHILKSISGNSDAVDPWTSI